MATGLFFEPRDAFEVADVVLGHRARPARDHGIDGIGADADQVAEVAADAGQHAVVGHFVGLGEQRSADLEVLLRDYVPKERVKPLVEALADLMNWRNGPAAMQKARVALAKFDEETK